jgi:hypothetical protein
MIFGIAKISEKYLPVMHFFLKLAIYLQKGKLKYKTFKN